MKGAWLKWVMATNLLAATALVFIYPHLMVSPGALMSGHRQLASDCFACHAPLRGASAERCVVCHKPSDIGLKTTQGQAVARQGAAVKVAFHQELGEQDCMACHSDHAGPKLTQRSRKPFSHGLLKPSTRERCESCHQAPADRLHKAVQGQCALCHQAQAWRPATFEHEKFFVLDRDHNAPCATCHRDSDYRRYTCYGCHEHTPANVLAEHREEGLTDIANCVRCHRSADEHGGERGGDDDD